MCLSVRVERFSAWDPSAIPGFHRSFFKDWMALQRFLGPLIIVCMAYGPKIMVHVVAVV